MKFLDLLIILIAAALFVFINEIGYAHLLSRYCVVVFMVAFYAGKYLTKWQYAKKA